MLLNKLLIVLSSSALNVYNKQSYDRSELITEHNRRVACLNSPFTETDVEGPYHEEGVGFKKKLAPEWQLQVKCCSEF